MQPPPGIFLSTINLGVPTTPPDNRRERRHGRVLSDDLTKGVTTLPPLHTRMATASPNAWLAAPRGRATAASRHGSFKTALLA